ncbi:hypothetical protein PR202_ga24284 [Eleusine coracana subsp. coracana]|uniref:Secreted protein n=1 Tax=Eleusine coracana subsp. coracana TaxID=191504 RepID=A0AAV5D8G1_ELECO|nr:hypothetical protein PR202_ga24284 [Eleusine coracana subsp. coracana]
MRRLHIDKILDCCAFSLCTSTCVTASAFVCWKTRRRPLSERKALVSNHRQLECQCAVNTFSLKCLSDLLLPLGFVLMVELRVSMHCNGCATKVQKHISCFSNATIPASYNCV